MIWLLAAIPAACFLGGYVLGGVHERKAWDLWLRSKH
jgi:hypothetical protein